MERKLNLPSSLSAAEHDAIMSRRGMVNDLTKQGLRICEIQVELQKRGISATHNQVMRDQKAMGLQSESWADRVRRLNIELPNMVLKGWSRERIMAAMRLKRETVNTLLAAHGHDDMLRALPHQKLTQREKEDIQRLRAEGHNITDLAETYGVSESHIGTITRCRSVATQRLHAEIQRLHDQGMTRVEIAAAMSKSYKVILYHAQKMNLPINKKPKAAKPPKPPKPPKVKVPRVNAKLRDHIVALRKQKLTYREIATELQCSVVTVRKRCKEAGIKKLTKD